MLIKIKYEEKWQWTQIGGWNILIKIELLQGLKRKIFPGNVTARLHGEYLGWLVLAPTQEMWI